MASTYSDLKIELIGTGEQSGTWGDTTNINLGTALEQAIVGRATAEFTSDADLTITLTDTNTTQVARNYILNVTSTGSLTATRNLIVPTINKPYLVENNTTGGQSIVVKTVSGTGITVPNGKTVMVYANSTNVVSGFTYAYADIVGNVTGNVSGNAGTVTNGVYLTGTQTLTGKTISADSNTLSGIAASSFVLSNSSGYIDGSAAQKAIPSGTVVGTSDTQTLTNKTLTDPAITGTIKEDVFTLTDAATIDIDPGNGSIQIVSLGGTARTLTYTNMLDGEAITLMIDDGTGGTITTWNAAFVNNSGAAPTLSTTGYTVVSIWKVGGGVYAAVVGNA